MGNVVAPGPVVKLAITRSSSDNEKASIHPAAIAGAISGNVIVMNVLNGGAAQIHRGLLKASIEGNQAEIARSR